MKNVDEAIRAYADMFGGFPAFLFMGASDEEIIKQTQEAILSGEEIEAPDDNVY
jgi:hypothetical protein|nr:MAG TPA: hypothetical protein [Caudoviricetes sp.]